MWLAGPAARGCPLGAVLAGASWARGGGGGGGRGLSVQLPGPRLSRDCEDSRKVQVAPRVSWLQVPWGRRTDGPCIKFLHGPSVAAACFACLWGFGSRCSLPVELTAPLPYLLRTLTFEHSAVFLIQSELAAAS